MNDICHYLKMDPWFRQYHHKDVTFSMVYAFSEQFVLPVSHDEVVHMKGSLRGKMPGDDWQQLAGVRGFYAVPAGPPRQEADSSWERSWPSGTSGTSTDSWTGICWSRRTAARLHECLPGAQPPFIGKTAALWENDCDWEGFEWLVADDNHSNVIVFLRRDQAGRELVCAREFLPGAPCEDYRFGVPRGKRYYDEVFNTDEPPVGGGSGVGDDGAA